MAMHHLPKSEKLFLQHGKPRAEPRAQPPVGSRGGAGVPRQLRGLQPCPRLGGSTGRAGQGSREPRNAAMEIKQAPCSTGQIFKHCPRTQQPEKIKNPAGYSPKPNTQNPLSSTALNMHVVTQNTSFHNNTSTLICI